MPSEEDKIRIACVWAGQRGHEKCGYCSNCHKPRWEEGFFLIVSATTKAGRKERCLHLREHIWRQSA